MIKIINNHFKTNFIYFNFHKELIHYLNIISKFNLIFCNLNLFIPYFIIIILFHHIISFYVLFNFLLVSKFNNYS